MRRSRSSVQLRLFHPRHVHTVTKRADDPQVRGHPPLSSRSGRSIRLDTTPRDSRMCYALFLVLWRPRVGGGGHRPHPIQTQRDDDKDGRTSVAAVSHSGCGKADSFGESIPKLLLKYVLLPGLVNGFRVGGFAILIVRDFAFEKCRDGSVFPSCVRRERYSTRWSGGVGGDVCASQKSYREMVLKLISPAVMICNGARCTCAACGPIEGPG